jgi:NAD-dependent DNA ligase
MEWAEVLSVELLQFHYTNARGETKLRAVTGWSEEGHYIVGNDVNVGGAPRTFRKDRITQYLEGCESALAQPFAGPPPKLSRAAPDENRPQILFTGFGASVRTDLEQRCDAAGLKVMKTVSQRLVFLCVGPNAGPAKVTKARQQGAFIVTEADLPELLESGVLPDRILD